MRARASLGRRTHALTATLAAACSFGLLAAASAQADEYIVVKDTAGPLGKGVEAGLNADPHQGPGRGFGRVVRSAGGAGWPSPR